MNTRVIVNFSLLLMLFLVSYPAWEQNSPTTGITSIHGQVRDGKTHAMVPNVIIRVDNQDSGNASQAETDRMGKFDFQGLYPAVYVVSVRVPGYREESQRLDLTVSGNSYVDFELQPIAPEAKSKQPGEIGSAVSAREAAVPEKARKEFVAGRRLLMEGKDLQGSIDHLQKATKFYPQFADAYLFLGIAYVQRNDATNAKQALQRAVEIDPKLAAAFFTLGMIFNGEKDYAAAEKSLTQGLALDPESADGQYELGRTYWALGKWQDAEPHAAKAAEVKPDMPPVHVLLGNIMLRKKDPQGALKEFQEYLKLDPQGPFAAGTQAMVDKLRKSLNTTQ